VKGWQELQVLQHAELSCALHFACIKPRSDLDKPLPAWRRRLVEVSSQTCSGTVLRAMGFWWPRVTGLEHYRRGQEMGAVSGHDLELVLSDWYLASVVLASALSLLARPPL